MRGQANHPGLLYGTRTASQSSERVFADHRYLNAKLPQRIIYPKRSHSEMFGYMNLIYDAEPITKAAITKRLHIAISHQNNSALFAVCQRTENKQAKNIVFGQYKTLQEAIDVLNRIIELYQKEGFATSPDKVTKEDFHRAFSDYANSVGR
jgi:hypothetical protein